MLLHLNYNLHQSIFKYTLWAAALAASFACVCLMLGDVTNCSPRVAK